MTKEKQMKIFKCPDGPEYIIDNEGHIKLRHKRKSIIRSITIHVMAILVTIWISVHIGASIVTILNL